MLSRRLTLARMDSRHARSSAGLNWECVAALVERWYSAAMRYRLTGYGPKLGWPLVLFGEHVSPEDAVAAARQMLMEEPHCERVELAVEGVVVRVLDRSIAKS
jgi:hypothetical protein